MSSVDNYKGIVRQVDELGRIVVPIELRRSLSIGHRDQVEIDLNQENKTIVIKKFQPGCILCGNENIVVHYKGKALCKECVNAAK